MVVSSGITNERTVQLGSGEQSPENEPQKEPDCGGVFLELEGREGLLTR